MRSSQFEEILRNSGLAFNEAEIRVLSRDCSDLEEAKAMTNDDEHPWFQEAVRTEWTELLMEDWKKWFGPYSQYLKETCCDYSKLESNPEET